MSGPARQFAATEARHATTALGALPGVLRVNRPQVNADCTKPVRLAAAACGLHVPDTLITNDPADAAPSAERCGSRIVTKVLSGSSPSASPTVVPSTPSWSGPAPSTKRKPT
ncbi:hypothetical protein I3F58_06320 [Streptomyces sp. MUM 203J]|uniref:hypothetical protein n=1 Tax=Streptomyces sp. MUM 203J TaxID=2791990 RepID=UPI001F039C0A|nr:hypothetical protein [Streptomyces sp. MUM 203J]MCH0539176.1 hypothetical protein [Streptomyces sp. MUM 203J]